MPEWLANVNWAEVLPALLTLTAMEIVLGIDNVVFIAVLAARLPESQRARARFVGLAAAMGMRILLLLTVTWIASLDGKKLFTLMGHGFTWRDLVMVLGGAFLIWKATKEIHHKMEGAGDHGPAKKPAAFAAVIGQIALMDLVFSIDSVITAVGMARDIWVMVAAVVASVLVMMAASGAISGFIDRHPTVKMLALSFLILIGVVLVADGLGQHVEKGYIYSAMGFSLGVELLNMRWRSKSARRAAPAGPPGRGGPA